MESDRTRLVAAIIAVAVIAGAVGRQVGIDTGFGRGAQAQAQFNYDACAGQFLPEAPTGFVFDEIGSLEILAEQQQNSADPITSDTATKVDLGLQNVAPSERAKEKQSCKGYLSLQSNTG